MKDRAFSVIFALILLTDLVAVAFSLDGLRYLSKPLLTVLPALWFFTVTRQTAAIYRVLMLSALLFSLLGDIFLLFEAHRAEYFLLGLGSFLLAHLCYIGFFLKVRYTNYPLPLCQWLFIFLTEAVVLALIFFLLPHLGSMTLPVIVYAIAISFTVLCVMHAFRFREQQAGWLCMAGAVLFLLSDAMIAIQRFYSPIPAGNILVMLTYGLAQWGLVSGSGRYLRTRQMYEWGQIRTN